jgi:hypothetical protein
MTDTMGVVEPQLAEDLKKLDAAKIPVDVRFEQGCRCSASRRRQNDPRPLSIIGLLALLARAARRRRKCRRPRRARHRPRRPPRQAWGCAARR